MLKKITPSQLVILALMLFFSALFLMPFIWTFLSALKTEPELFQYPPQMLPEKFLFHNFVDAWTSQNFNTYLKNSAIVVVLSTFGQLLSSSMVAYGFARFDFPYKNTIFMVLLITMIIPWDVKMIPLYMQFNYWGWIDTLKPLIVPAYFGEAFFVFLLRQYIMGIPRELDEAAKVDGASGFQIYFFIHLPLMIPALILVGTFHFLNAWNDYLGPLIFLNNPENYTLTLGLSLFNSAQGGGNIVYVSAITTLICLPPLFLFFLAQRYIMGDVSTGSVKG